MHTALTETLLWMCECYVCEWMRVGEGGAGDGWLVGSVYVVCLKRFCSEDSSKYGETKLCWLKLLLVYTTNV